MRSFTLLALAGCLAKPPRPDDGLVDAAVAPPCAEPPISDTFDDVFANVCGVGFEDGNTDSMISRGGGVLREAPAANVVNDASCTWPSFDFDLGAFVQVRQVLRAGGTYTIMQITVDSVQVGIGVIYETAPLLQLFDRAEGGDGVIASLPYDASEMQWWRLRPAGGRIAADYSSDGATWIELGVTALSAAPTVDIDVSLNAGAYNALSDPGTAEFDNFNICP